MKNHFIMSYAGNKRNEVADLVKELDFDKITTIVEPYCGTAAFSWYVSTLYPGKFRYVLNDNSDELQELYRIMQNETLFEKLIADATALNEGLTLEKYKKIKAKKDFMAWFYANTSYNFRVGCYPITGPKNYEKIRDAPIIQFLRNENVQFTQLDGVAVYEKYKTDPDVLLFLDPPYISSCNDFYSAASGNIYEYLFVHSIDEERAKIVLILENIWIIQLLFKDKGRQILKDKTYSITHKKTQHVTVINRA